MPTASNGQVVKVLLIPDNKGKEKNRLLKVDPRHERRVYMAPGYIASHTLTPIHRPGAPGLLLLEAQAAGPVLRLVGVDARVRVSVVYQDSELVGSYHFFVPMYVCMYVCM